MEPTGRIEEWVLWNGKIWGNIFDDKKGRFEDGIHIHTSSIVPEGQKCKEGAVITTRNSAYLLGKSM